ncbi:Farnesyl diphosphate synthase-like protein [Operophtera brumata]|uniref:Farnesyl diphosphate synthase-like protein n=1 Tax=Operophtera brumata TaxID=104452 RepID=A0A0L7L6A6_OPEBR|nr:Farnesyl diphosphate synthase-like protein [Operophtera brumata]
MSTQHEIGTKERNLFLEALPSVIDSALANPKVAEIPGLKEWTKKLLTHNMTGGKGARGLTIVMAYQMLEQPEKLTEESMHLARTLGWCYEMLQSFMCVFDDIMDGSEKRRGKPCWYLLPDVGPACAINDSLMLYNFMFYLLKKNFGVRNYKTAEHKANDYSLFTVERHETIIKYKTAYYTYDLPTKLGLLLADYKVDVQTKKLMQDVSLEIGLLFQTQDDYIDSFGDETLTGKVGTDIQEGKCSWLAVNALQRCNASQRVVFNACYGSKEPAHLERCKQLYCDLKLPELYKEVESRYYDDILERIQGFPTDELKRLYHRLLEITYQRKK